MYLGVDLGGTNIAVGLVDDHFKILHKDSVPTGAQRQDREIVRDMSALCLKVLADTGTSASDVRWIGVGAPGTPDVASRSIIYTNNINMRNTPLGDWMREDTGLPVYLDNDANCAALGEAYAGATKGVSHSVMITIGTGLGGGIIINKKIYSGFNFAGGELGHNVIVMGGEPCTCGRKGCWEAYASANALKRLTREAIAAEPDSQMSELTGRDPENVSGKTAFDAMRGGCPVGTAVVEAYIKYFAAGIINMINTFQPEVLVIGGGVCKEGDYLLTPLKEIVAREVYSRDVRQTEIRIAQLGNDAGIIGAAALGF
ncbi:MAG: ROK family glucokinase [Clostridiales bacterium]|jgi:glucokinase|nr:ROK family glucokinase [Clostridiales bacterium]